jgi:hypothetical protein
MATKITRLQRQDGSIGFIEETAEGEFFSFYDAEGKAVNSADFGEWTRTIFFMHLYNDDEFGRTIESLKRYKFTS